MTTTSDHIVVENCFERRDLCELIEPYLVYDDNKNTAFVLINVHHTRQISAHHGFDSATDMMSYLASELTAYVKEDCKLIRSGNHEFALILQNLKNPGHCQLALNSIERNVNNKTHSGKSYSTKTHITISAALYPKHAITAESLIQSAEIAMYQADQNDLSQCMYTESMSNRIEHKLRIESELDAAILGQLLEVWYQPKINLKDGTLYGVEALCRWKNDKEGYISPEIFIPIAEDSILIKDLTHWVINTALRTLKDWQKMGLKINCAVNISGRVVDDHEFVSMVEHIAGVWSVDYQFITLEVTETAMMQSFESNLDKLRHLKELGFHISMDDFGTGYSSLEYFKNLPVDEVKIDKSFVIHMMENEADRKMVSMIAGLSRGFGLKIVAEGVENEAALQALKELGVHRGQGFHIAKPMPENEFLTWAEFYLTNLKKNNSV